MPYRTNPDKNWRDARPILAQSDDAARMARGRLQRLDTFAARIVRLDAAVRDGRSGIDLPPTTSAARSLYDEETRRALVPDILPGRAVSGDRCRRTVPATDADATRTT